jgi:hypothetical protein
VFSERIVAVDQTDKVGAKPVGEWKQRRVGFDSRSYLLLGAPDGRLHDVAQRFVGNDVAPVIRQQAAIVVSDVYEIFDPPRAPFPESEVSASVRCLRFLEATVRLVG